jgi:3-methyladenine DNA glycosylase AlkD
LVTRISKDHYKLFEKDKDWVFKLCEELFRTGFLEESFVACNWSYYTRDLYTLGDLETFEKWLNNYISNWASCDTLCNHTIGSFLEKYPEEVEKLKSWAHSDNRWMRRAAAVSFIIPARNGLLHSHVLEIAEILLNDKDDLVQKGYGWMLKAASEADSMMVFDFLVKHKHIMPCTSFRYAMEKLPAEMVAKLKQ